jgi:hypothetical protein
MTEYFVKQFDGGSTTCDGKNCAAASGATAVAFGSGGAQRPTSDAFRKTSGVSCVPGEDTKSGGLTVQAVERTAALYGVDIDFGKVEGSVRRWTIDEIKGRVNGDYGAVLPGDYDQLPSSIDEQPGFNGDHSVWIHDGTPSDACWHDPLGDKPRRVSWSVIEKYNQKPGSPVEGLAGFVLIPQEELMNIYSVPGEREVQIKVGTPYRNAPGGTVQGTISGSRWFLLAGQDAKVASWYLLDGSEVGAAGLMSWVPASSVIASRDASWEAGRAAAAKAAADVRQ